MNKRHKIYAVCGIFLLIEILLFNFFDRPISDYVRNLDTTHHNLINIFRAYTDFGKGKWYLWPSAFGILICVLVTRRTSIDRILRVHAATWGNRFVIIFAAVAISGLVADAIKPFIGRARPVLYGQDGTYGFNPPSFHAVWNSMPSGHSTTAFTLAITLSMLFPRYKYVWWAYGIILALSRIMVNAHFLSDVLAGAAVAVVTTFFIKQVLTRYGMFHVEHSFFPIDSAKTIDLKNSP